jgi:dTDP-4-dehydrorhamnose reductase
VKVLVLGAGGMLGRDVVRAAERANHEVAALARADVDVTDAGAVRAAIRREAPAAVVNCAAYTNVDGAESEPGEAGRVNATGAGLVAGAAAEAGAAIVYPSTDYVFDGEKATPYTESDAPNPLSAYGRSKLAGERATIEANERHFVVRSSWLFGAGGRNFVDTMLGLAETEDQVLVVRDQVGSPTFAGHLAEGIVRLLDTVAFGLHHMSAAGECSWYEFAQAIFERAGVECRVLSCTSAELARPAPRPFYSVLETEWSDAIRLPPWEEGLAAYLAERVAAR